MQMVYDYWKNFDIKSLQVKNTFFYYFYQILQSKYFSQIVQNDLSLNLLNEMSEKVNEVDDMHRKSSHKNEVAFYSP